MKRMLTAALGLLLLGPAGAGFAPTISAQAAEGWTTLFDGKNLDQWTVVGEANWKLTGGYVEATTGAGHLVSKQSFGDFELRAEFWASPDANSAIFFRLQDPKNVSLETAYEVNIYDMRPDQAYRTGGIVRVAKVLAIVNAGNRWNTMEISAKGPRLIVKVNDVLTADAQDTKFARGHVTLQSNGGTVRFRNVQVREGK